MTSRFIAISIAFAMLLTSLVSGGLDTVTLIPPAVVAEQTAVYGLGAEAIAAGDQALADSLKYFSDRQSFDQAFEYFKQVAFDSEYRQTTSHLKRWIEPINISVEGQYTKDDYIVLGQLFVWLDQIDGLPPITIVPSGGNHQCMFYPLAEFDERIENYVSGNWAFASIWWDENYHIWKSYAAVSTDVTNQLQRNHLIQEEFIQSLGLLQDSYDYPDSIFQQEWTETQYPIAIDFAMIRMLYSPALTMSMNIDQAYSALLLFYGLD